MAKVTRAAWPGLVALLGTTAAAQDPPRLSLPIDCQPGVTCFIQSHVDAVPGSESGDYRCGSATYDGHKGVDFRLLSAAVAREGVAVLASADGVVKGGRDGMADEFAAPEKRAAIASRECGNGVVLDHGAGWETQYCHMRAGSVAVQRGAKVKRGDKLGLVGYSGLAELAHVHISVRHNGAVIDPFTAGAGEAACRLAGAGGAATVEAGLWDDNAARAFPYRNGEIIGAGFAGAPVTPLQLETDHRVAPPDAASPAVLLYARVMNMRAGDNVRFVLSGPDGLAHEQATAPLDRTKATYVAYTGKKLTKPRWPAGRYQGRVELLRQGAIVDHREVPSLDLK